MSEAFIVRTRDDWLKQAKEGQDAWEKVKDRAPNLRELAKVDYEAFCKIIEAYYALGVSVDKELMNLAKMTPVKDALGLP